MRERILSRLKFSEDAVQALEHGIPTADADARFVYRAAATAHRIRIELLQELLINEDGVALMQARALAGWP